MQKATHQLMADDTLIQDKLLNQIKIFNNLDIQGVVYGPSIQNIINNNEYIANVVRIRRSFKNTTMKIYYLSYKH